MSDQPVSGLQASGQPLLRRAHSRWRWAVAAIFADAALVIGLAWWLFPSIWAVGVAVVDIDQSAGPDIGVNLSEVANNPKVMWDRRVTISGEVDEIFAPRVLLIGNDAPFVGDKVLIVGATPFDGLVTDPPGGSIGGDDVIRVTGVVERFDPAALEAALGPDLALPADRYDGAAVVVAESIELNPPEHPGPGDKEFPAGSSGYEIGVTVNDIVTRPEEYVGETVEVSDEIDEPALTPNVFVLGDEQLLVVSAEPTPDVFIEATAYVVGEVRLFDLTTMEAELGLDLDDAMLAPFAGEPVVVARSIAVVS